MVSSQMEEQKGLAYMLSWFTSKPISGFILRLAELGKGVKTIQAPVTFLPGMKIFPGDTSVPH